MFDKSQFSMNYETIFEEDNVSDIINIVDNYCSDKKGSVCKSLVFCRESLQEKIVIQMRDVMRNIYYLRNRRFKLLTFYAHLIHDLNKPLFGDEAIATVQFHKFMPYLLTLSFILHNDGPDVIDVLLIGLLIHRLGLSDEFLHFFHEVLGEDGFLAGEFIFFEEVDDNDLDVGFTE